MKKIKIIKKPYFYLIILILSMLTIADSYKFLNSINDGIISVQDIILYSIYGLNENARTNFIDVVKFSSLYIIIIYINSIYLHKIWSDSTKYLYLIRYKSISLWLQHNIKMLIKMILTIVSIYYGLIILITFICIRNKQGFTETFYMLNPYCNKIMSSTKLILFQCLLTMCASILITLIQLLISSKNSYKGFIYMSLFMILLVYLGTMKLYNPLMLSKHVDVNSNSYISVFMTIGVESILIAFTYLLIIKVSKLIIRSEDR